MISSIKIDHKLFIPLPEYFAKALGLFLSSKSMHDTMIELLGILQ
jgi:hypothetical protein